MYWVSCGRAANTSDEEEFFDSWPDVVDWLSTHLKDDNVVRVELTDCWECREDTKAIKRLFDGKKTIVFNPNEEG